MATKQSVRLTGVGMGDRREDIEAKVGGNQYTLNHKLDSPEPPESFSREEINSLTALRRLVRVIQRNFPEVVFFNGGRLMTECQRVIWEAEGETKPKEEKT